MKHNVPTLSTAQRERQQHARDLLSEVTRLDGAIDAKGIDITKGELQRDNTAKALAERDADLALATDEASAMLIESDVKKLTAQLLEAQANVDRQVRIKHALAERLVAAEDAVRVEHQAFQSLVVAHRGEVLQTLAADVAEASRPLIDALRRYTVAANAMGSSPAVRLGDMQLPDLRSNGFLLYGLNLSAYVDGAVVPLSDIGGDPTLAELVRVLGEPHQVLKSLASTAARAKYRGGIGALR